jgi:chemotaxis protein histidine kinase CheA
VAGIPGVDAQNGDNTTVAPVVAQVKDADIPPQFREVFIEESDEIVAELAELAAQWGDDPQVNGVLREMRRHFHTFKGNGRAVGANILGELGWAAQDMLDRVLDGDLAPSDSVQQLVDEVVAALPDLVMSYRRAEGPDLERIRHLTQACFHLAEGRERDLADQFPAAQDVVTSPSELQHQPVVNETLTH